MSILRILFIAFAAMVAYSPFPTCLAETPTLSSNEAETLTYLRVFSKYKWDFYRGSGGQQGPIPEEPILLALADKEKQRLDTLGFLLDYYGIADPVVSYEIWVYPEGYISDDLMLRAFDVGWGPRTMQVQDCAYLEEMNIIDLRLAIAETDELRLFDAYTDMLGKSYSNLVLLVSWLERYSAGYAPQLLDLEDFDQIIANNVPSPVGEFFVINAGLNDAWFDPETSGQGFFITVYPSTQTIIMSWLTFDTEQPESGATAHLGDPCQRWFTAQGHYEGAVADLVVYSASGGVFNESTFKPVLDEIGSISLEFEHCNHGTITYDLPDISASGEISIQRIALDNVDLCETLAKTAAN